MFPHPQGVAGGKGAGYHDHSLLGGALQHSSNTARSNGFKHNDRYRTHVCTTMTISPSTSNICMYYVVMVCRSPCHGGSPTKTSSPALGRGTRRSTACWGTPARTRHQTPGIRHQASGIKRQTQASRQVFIQ